MLLALTLFLALSASFFTVIDIIEALVEKKSLDKAFFGGLVACICWGVFYYQINN